MASEPATGNNSQFVVTAEGYKKLQEELEFLKTVKAPQVAERIKQATSYGDLSENAEYEEAKNEQGFMNGRIIELEAALRNAVVMEKSTAPAGVVEVGSKVRVLDMEYKEEDEYTIVGFTESDPARMHISNESPIGAALLGAKKGDVVSVHTPGGLTKLKVLKVT